MNRSEKLKIRIRWILIVLVFIILSIIAFYCSRNEPKVIEPSRRELDSFYGSLSTNQLGDDEDKIVGVADKNKSKYLHIVERLSGQLESLYAANAPKREITEKLKEVTSSFNPGFCERTPRIFLYTKGSEYVPRKYDEPADLALRGNSSQRNEYYIIKIIGNEKESCIEAVYLYLKSVNASK